MAEQSLGTIHPPSRPQASLQPCLHILVAAAIGIVVDRLTTTNLFIIALLFLFCATGWIVFCRRGKRITGWILILAMAGLLAALWHHVHWHTIFPRDISLFAGSERRPAVIRGRLVQQPNWVFESKDAATFSLARGTRSRTILEVSAIRDRQTFVPAHGRVEVFVAGQIGGLVSGDQVLVCGQLKRIDRPTNPGQFDFQKYSRGKRIYCLLSVDHPDNLQRDDVPTHWVMTWMGRLRTWLDGQIWKYVDAEQAPLASAMLLGNRQQLDQIQQTRFLVSGTIHLLAISGLHVGILASFFLLLPRVNLLSRRGSLLVTALFVICYAGLVEFRPPVVRAAILIAVFCLCKWIGRKPFSINSLAFAALVVLVINPADLFNSGAQLSFLAVATLMIAHRWLVIPATTDPIDRLIQSARPLGDRMCRKFVLHLRTAAIASAIIWLLALPLVAFRFHIVAPIALIANPLLLIPVTAGLFFGFGVLVFGWLFPPIGVLCGKACGYSVSLIQLTVQSSEQIPFGHFWISGPTANAVGLFYAGLFLICIFHQIRFSAASITTGLLVWFALGWWLPAFFTAQQDLAREEMLSVTFVDVGHGGCVLLRTPDGQNVVYDCGSFGSPRFAQRNVAGVLWHERVSHIDKLVISHADSDHFNALPELARRFSIGRVIMSEAMADKLHRPILRRLTNEFRSHGIGITTVSAGDQISICDQFEIRVLSPPVKGFGQTDNADSIVLDVLFDQFRLLLPGDLDQRGLDQLLQGEPIKYDVVLAPHHGSLNSRPGDFVRWSDPTYVIINNDRCEAKKDYQNAAGEFDFRILQTGVDGAIRVVARADGLVEVRSWLDAPW